MVKKKVNKKRKPKVDKTEILRQKVVDALKIFIIHYVQIEKFCKARTAGQALENIMNLKEQQLTVASRAALSGSGITCTDVDNHQITLTTNQ